MGLSTAERNRRKRERKKHDKKKEEEQQQYHKQHHNDRLVDATQQEEDAAAPDIIDVESMKKHRRTWIASEDVAADTADTDSSRIDNTTDVDIEYVPEPLEIPDTTPREEFEMFQRYHERAVATLIVEDDTNAARSGERRRGAMFNNDNDDDDNDDDESRDDEDEDDDFMGLTSKRKLREKIRPSVADLKRRVQRPDLVEAHDVTATDPDFLIHLKAVPGTVPVPRHWGRKRKYLQGKRGYEKPPFQLPEFIVSTGITSIRDAVAEQESNQSIRQKNRARVAPKMGAMDVDYRTLHDAFFKHQTKPSNLTKFGDVYYEGKELEIDPTKIRPGATLSAKVREALGMTYPTSPPPWLLNMQRYGPPPSYPGLKIAGLNAPLPSPECQYGYHPGGWGKPPVDPYGRPLYGGNPFDPPGTGSYLVGFHGGNGAGGDDTDAAVLLVTSDGKTISKKNWGSLPFGAMEQEEEEEDESSSDEEMEESESEEEQEDVEEQNDDETGAAADRSGMDSVLPPPLSTTTAPGDLRKQTVAGDETPAPPKQLYQVLEQRKASQQAGAVFASNVAYVLPPPPPPLPAVDGEAHSMAAAVPEGAESVLSKAVSATDPVAAARRRKQTQTDDDDDVDLEKNFKF